MSDYFFKHSSPDACNKANNLFLQIEIDKNDPWVEEVNVENYDVLGSADIKKNIEDISYTMYTCNFCPQIFTDR